VKSAKEEAIKIKDAEREAERVAERERGFTSKKYDDKDMTADYDAADDAEVVF